MGNYVVNGEVIEVAQEIPTASDIKAAIGAPGKDIVMVTRQNGTVERVPDHAPVPKDTQDIGVVPQFEYGRPQR